MEREVASIEERHKDFIDSLVSVVKSTSTFCAQKSQIESLETALLECIEKIKEKEKEIVRLHDSAEPDIESQRKELEELKLKLNDLEAEKGKSIAVKDQLAESKKRSLGEFRDSYESLTCSLESASYFVSTQRSLLLAKLSAMEASLAFPGEDWSTYPVVDDSCEPEDVPYSSLLPHPDFFDSP